MTPQRQDAFRLGVHAALRHSGCTLKEAAEALQAFEAVSWDPEKVVRSDVIQKLAGCPGAVQKQDARRIGMSVVLKHAGCPEEQIPGTVLQMEKRAWGAMASIARMAGGAGKALAGGGGKALGAMGRGLSRAGAATEGAAGRLARPSVPLPELPGGLPPIPGGPARTWGQWFKGGPGGAPAAPAAGRVGARPNVPLPELPGAAPGEGGMPPLPPIPSAPGAAPAAGAARAAQPSAWFPGSPQSLANMQARVTRIGAKPGDWRDRFATWMEGNKWKSPGTIPANIAAYQYGPGIVRGGIRHLTGADQDSAAPAAPQYGDGESPQELQRQQQMMQMMYMMSQMGGGGGGGYDRY
jgi:hypothetical protein